MKFKKVKKNRSADLDEEEKIKINFNSRKNKAIIFAITILIATIVGSYMVLEYVHSQNRIILATTTSTYDSGLLDYLLPVFERRYRISVDVLSVGTGQALEAGEKGDADVLLVHARDKEDDLVDDDYGVHRVCVMYNDFIIVGPNSDPANINGRNITAAMSKLKNSGETGTIKFYSRGDNSGTHIKELKLWKLIGFTPDTSEDDWYFETGSGMGNTLTVTDDNEAYTLIDRGTWLSSKDKVSLTDLVYGEDILLNPYGAIAVNPEINSNVKFEHAKTFIGFLVSEEGQELIRDFRKNNEILFRPAFGICDKTHNCPTKDEEIDFWEEFNGEYTGPTSESALITISFINFELN
ncbi:MAG: substrate-binding domain-containing protein [Candidatus Hodarchaeota archaeon]